MNTNYITPETLNTLSEKYPAAYAFLQHENLLEEARQLVRELSTITSVQRANWITARLEELEALHII